MKLSVLSLVTSAVVYAMVANAVVVPPYCPGPVTPFATPEVVSLSSVPNAMLLAPSANFRDRNAFHTAGAAASFLSQAPFQRTIRPVRSVTRSVCLSVVSSMNTTTCCLALKRAVLRLQVLSHVRLEATVRAELFLYSTKACTFDHHVYN